MAYREFRNENTYAAPEFNGLPYTLQAIQDLNQRKLGEKKLKAEKDKKREDEFKNITFDAPEEIDKEYITKNKLNPFLERMTKHKVAGGHATDDVIVQDQKLINGLVAKSKTDAAILAQTKDLITNKPDWYNKGDATELAKELYAGSGRTVENRDVSNLIAQVDERNNPALFNQQTFVQKALETMKQHKYGNSSNTESGSHDGAATTKSNFSLSTQAGIRYNDKTKTYEIDPALRGQVLNEFFSFGGEGGGKTWRHILEKETEGELDAEVQKFVAAQKAKGLEVDPADVKREFMLDATKNPYAGGKTIAQRVAQKAEKQILLQSQIDHQYDYDKVYDQVEKPDSNDSDSSDKKLELTPAYHAGQAESANVKNKQYGGPGMTLRYKTKPLLLRTTAPTTFTVDSGTRKDNQKLERTLQTDKLVFMPTTKSGNLGYIKADTQEEFIAAINNMSDEQILSFDAELKPYFRGQISDKFNTAYDSEEEAYTPGEKPSQQVRNAKKAGVTQEISHEFVPATDDMFGQLKAYGTSRESLITPEVKAAQDVWRARYQKAAQKKKGTTTTTAKQNTPAAPASSGGRWDKYKN